MNTIIKKISSLLLALGLASLLAACLDSGGSGSGKSAKFVDSAVVGISFETSSGATGVTGEDGGFKYENGDTVTFFIGDIELPSVTPDGPYITPAHLAGVENWENDDTTLNIARFLQSIDDDGDLDNGIQISNKAKKNATVAVDFEKGVAAFESSVNNFIQALGVTLVSEADAKAHLKATIKDLGITITIDDDGDCSGGWTLVVETAGVKAEGICSPAVPTEEIVQDAISQTGEIQGSVTTEVNTATKKVYVAQVEVTGSPVAVTVKYIYTKN